MPEIYITIPGIPPSVNAYVRHSRGRHYKTDEAEAFAQKVALAAGEFRGMKVEATGLEILVCLGKGQRGDLDNFSKVPLDSLARCGVIRSDATITRIVLEKTRGEPPETDIWIQY